MPTPAPEESSRFVQALFLLVFGLALWFVLRMIAVFVAAIVLALVLASLFWPVYRAALSRCGGRRNLAAGLVTGLVATVVLVPLVLLILSLSAQAYGLYETASEGALIEQVRRLAGADSPLTKEAQALSLRFGIDLSPERLASLGVEAAKEVARYLYEQLGGFASNAVGVLVHFGMMIVLLFGFFAEGERLKAYVLDLSPLPDEQELTIAARFASISRAVFLGNGLSSVLQGVFGGLGYYLFGIGSGALWGAAIAFFAFLPMVGASLVVLPTGVVLYLTGRPGLALGFLAYNAGHVFVLEYIVKPRLIGGQGQMNGVLVFFGMVAGIRAFDLLGLFYGPLVLTMFLTLAEMYRAHYREGLLHLVRQAAPTAPVEAATEAATEARPAPAIAPPPAAVDAASPARRLEGAKAKSEVSQA